MFADDLNETSVEGYQILHIRAGQRFVFSKMEIKLHAGIRNLGDAEYFDNVRINAFGGRFYEPAPGRHYFGGILVQF